MCARGCVERTASPDPLRTRHACIQSVGVRGRGERGERTGEERADLKRVMERGSGQGDWEIGHCLSTLNRTVSTFLDDSHL